MIADYSRMLRMHLLAWSGVFAVLALAWIVTLIGGLFTGNPWPVLTVSAVLVLGAAVSRIRIRQLAAARDHAEDERLVQALRKSLEGL